MGEEDKKATEEQKEEAEKKEAAQPQKKGEEGKKQKQKQKKKKKKKKEKEEENTGKNVADGDGKAAEKGAEGGGEDEKGKEAPPPPPPEEIVMRVYMHCEGCARKVQRSLAGFPGVVEVMADYRTHRVVVKGKEAAAFPLRVVERLQKKSGRRVELLTPIPSEPEPKVEKKEEEAPKPVEEKKEEPKLMQAVLKVRMHCDACSQEMKKRILKMKGVKTAETDVKASQVTVRGVFEPAALADQVCKRTGRHAVVLKAEPVEEKAPGGEAGGGAEKDKAEGGGPAENTKQDVAAPSADGVGTAEKGAEGTMNPFCYYYPRFQGEDAYPPQMFSDENPNACSIM